ncbi:MAG TPA: S41 family peptidase, partial [Bryobacteraceae bacterium]
MSQRPRLDYKQRARIFDKVFKEVTRHYFDPKFNGTDWPQLALSSRDEIVTVEDPEAFELAMHGLVRRLGTSHTGFFHQSVRRVPARLAIGATFSRRTVNGSALWAATVHSGGPADTAGLKPGDILISVDGKPLLPPDQPMFAMGAEFELKAERSGEPHTLRVVVPMPRYRRQPYCEPQPVSWSKLDQNTGYLKVSILPGLLGLDVARQIDAAVAGLSECDRMILDLRGHLGGGLGVLRLMSHLTPKTSLALRFGRRDSSVVLVSEGLGQQKWHGHVAILVNEHTVSAGEMVAAFASENELATIIGTETAGR